MTSEPKQPYCVFPDEWSPGLAQAGRRFGDQAGERATSDVIDMGTCAEVMQVACHGQGS